MNTLFNSQINKAAWLIRKEAAQDLGVSIKDISWKICLEMARKGEQYKTSKIILFFDEISEPIEQSEHIKRSSRILHRRLHYLSVTLIFPLCQINITRYCSLKEHGFEIKRNGAAKKLLLEFNINKSFSISVSPSGQRGLNKQLSLFEIAMA